MWTSHGFTDLSDDSVSSLWCDRGARHLRHGGANRRGLVRFLLVFLLNIQAFLFISSHRCYSLYCISLAFPDLSGRRCTLCPRTAPIASSISVSSSPSRSLFPSLRLGRFRITFKLLGPAPGFLGVIKKKVLPRATTRSLAGNSRA